MEQHKDELANLITPKVERITDWLTKSGLKVNVAKTELCLFYKAYMIVINLNGKSIS